MVGYSKLRVWERKAEVENPKAVSSVFQGDSDVSYRLSCEANHSKNKMAAIL